MSPYSRVSSHQDFPNHLSCSLKHGSLNSAKSLADLPSRHHLCSIDNWAWQKSCITLFCFKSFPKPTSRAQGGKISGLLVTCKAHPQEFEEAGLQKTLVHSHPKIPSVEPTPLLIKTLPSAIGGTFSVLLSGLQFQGHASPPYAHTQQAQGPTLR